MPAIDYKTDILRKLGELPPFSPVLQRVLASLANDDLSYHELGKQIEQDTVLAGNVLRIVNSAAYGRRGTVTAIPHAISILGLNKLRNLILSFSISKMWSTTKPAPGWSHERFNLHSLATALVADGIAQHADVEFAEGAFVAGLLHDFGKLLVAVALPADYIEIVEMAKITGRSWHECEQSLLGETHATYSALAIERWNLPEPVQRAAARHHEPESRQGSLWPLSLTVATADAVVNQLGHTVLALSELPGPETAEFAHRMLADTISETAAAAILEDFSREFQAITSLIR